MKSHGITTFYSFKGGVGRTMSLANAAVRLAREGRRTLAVDFDLDAPGLSRYFPESDAGPRAGVLDLFTELERLLLDRFAAPDSYDPADPANAPLLREMVKCTLDQMDCFANAGVENLTLLGPGRDDGTYAERLTSFNWVSLYTQFGEVFGLLREELLARFDAVLIDARTGLTDIGSLSSVVLPDRLVIVFTPNAQSIEGGAEIASQAQDQHHRMREVKRSNRSLQIIPLLGRVDRGEVDLRNEWTARAAAAFSPVVKRSKVDLVHFFDSVHIPYSPYHAYGERLAVPEGRDQGLGSLDEAYGRLHGLLLLEDFDDWFLQPGARDRALIVPIDGEVELPSDLSVERVIQVAVPHLGSTFRLHPEDRPAWQDLDGALVRAIRVATQGLRGRLHVFGQLPYSAAVLLGRRLDDLARGRQVIIHHSQNGIWTPFSSEDGRSSSSGDQIYLIEDVPVADSGAQNLLIALEGIRPLPDGVLGHLAAAIGAGRAARLRQRRAEFLRPGSEAVKATQELRIALARLQSERPGATIHLVSTAPDSLMIELGRMLTPNVVRGAIVHEYQARTGDYRPTPDLLQLGGSSPEGLEAKT